MIQERFVPAKPQSEGTQKLLASLWQRNLPMLRDRVAQLERAVSAAWEANLTVELREGAWETAHKLAGSLGMFGYPKGTQIARRIEQQLEGHSPVDASALADDVAALRAILPL